MIDNQALARRAVACPAWRWMERMHVLQHYVPSTLCWLDKQGRWNASTGGVWMRFSDMSNLLPDLADRATIGCLEGLVADAWDAEVMVLAEVIRSGPHAGKVSHRVAIFRPENAVDWGWTERYIFEASPDRALRPMSRAEALVAALEAAPAREVKS